MTTLTHEECLRALSKGSVGRVAITAQALPAIVPVNYTLDGRAIVFRTQTDGMLARACDGNVVAFEVDQLAHDGRTGWSVLVIGVAALLSGSDALRALQLNLASAAGEDRDQFVSIATGRISGRRIGAALLTESSGSGGANVGGEEMEVASCP
jgi:nitroimidazol reductase NimA-like FMN-containing flavoprotein (pyridoxamine 5'-phosphate oxidase superfamily)